MQERKHDMALLILLGTVIVLAIIFFIVSMSLKDDDSDSSKIPIFEETEGGEGLDEEGGTSDEFDFG